MSHRPLALVVLFGAGCQLLGPAAVPPASLPRGYYVSQPVAGVRALNDVLVLSPDLAYAVGTGGTVLKLDKTTWSAEDTGVTSDLEAISGFLNADGTEVLLVVGADGTVLARGAPGKWGIVPSGTTKLLFSVHVRSATDAFVVGEAGTILRWNGTALALQTAQTQQLLVGGACVVNADCGANSVCGTDPNTGNPACNSFFGIPENLKGVNEADRMIAVGSSGAVYTFDANSASGTQTWAKEDPGTTRPLAGVFTGDGTLIPATDGVLVVRGCCDANGNNTFDDATLITPAPVYLQDVWGTGPDIFAVGLSEDVYRYDASQTWTLTRVTDAAEIRGIDGVVAPPPTTIATELLVDISSPPDGLADHCTADAECAGPFHLVGTRCGTAGVDKHFCVQDPPANDVRFIAVGGGGRIVRGPTVLPFDGETLLTTRLSTDDFVGNGP